jgi:hypothetical protein
MLWECVIDTASDCGGILYWRRCNYGDLLLLLPWITLELLFVWWRCVFIVVLLCFYYIICLLCDGRYCVIVIVPVCDQLLFPLYFIDTYRDSTVLLFILPSWKAVPSLVVYSCWLFVVTCDEYWELLWHLLWQWRLWEATRGTMA